MFTLRENHTKRNDQRQPKRVQEHADKCHAESGKKISEHFEATLLMRERDNKVRMLVTTEHGAAGCTLGIPAKALFPRQKEGLLVGT